ncbi:hypothetical protein Ocin01_16570 [Orchesella cincta]|uniref:Uncharacterized protein n=1 Tax=Orchesella cincta TaxID=48709 RepID=A0A1D2MB23_ORCCI|nr:hypothetical protein Ocin01_16570 [Orchesella cincta]
MKQVFSNQASVIIPHITAWVEQFSTLRKLISTTAIILMFIKSRAKKIEASYPVTPLERIQTRNHLISRVQAICFPDEMRRLKEGKEIQSSSPLIKLIPYIDGAGVLRVTGESTTLQSHQILSTPLCSQNVIR